MKNKLKKELRDSLRQSRRNLLSKDQVFASKRVFDLVVEQGFFISATYVAFYLSFDGEIDPRPIAQRAMDLGKSCYLPIISDEDAHQMAFDLYDQSSILKENKWGRIINLTSASAKEPALGMTLSNVTRSAVISLSKKE